MGLTLPFGVPIEEFLFFPVVAIAGILTLEAVRSVLDTRPDLPEAAEPVS